MGQSQVLYLQVFYSRALSCALNEEINGSLICVMIIMFKLTFTCSKSWHNKLYSVDIQSY